MKKASSLPARSIKEFIHHLKSSEFEVKSRHNEQKNTILKADSFPDILQIAS